MLIWCLISNPSLSVGFSIQDAAMDAVRPARHADIIYLFTLLGIKKGARLGLHKLAGAYSEEAFVYQSIGPGFESRLHYTPGQVVRGLLLRPHGFFV